MDDGMLIMLITVDPPHKGAPQRAKRFAAVIAIATGLASIACCLPARADTFDAVPVQNLLVIFADAFPQFDNSNNTFFSSGPIVQVQFPGEVISTSDPIVSPVNVLSISGAYSGQPFTTIASLDKNLVLLNVTVTITSGGRLAYREIFPEERFVAAYTTPNSFIADWGGESTGTKFADFSVLDTPFFEAYFNSDQAGTTDYDIGSRGRITTSDAPLPAPEPATVLVLGSGLVALAGLRLRGRLTRTDGTCCR
jgi:hypothetical protein